MVRAAHPDCKFVHGHTANVVPGFDHFQVRVAAQNRKIVEVLLHEQRQETNPMSSVKVDEFIPTNDFDAGASSDFRSCSLEPCQSFFDRQDMQDANAGVNQDTTYPQPPPSFAERHKLRRVRIVRYIPAVPVPLGKRKSRLCRCVIFKRAKLRIILNGPYLIQWEFLSGFC